MKRKRRYRTPFWTVLEEYVTPRKKLEALVVEAQRLGKPALAQKYTAALERLNFPPPRRPCGPRHGDHPPRRKESMW
jgi:hypothetical protein